MTENVWIVFDANNKPVMNTVADTEFMSKKKASISKVWRILEARGYRCLNVDIDIKLRG